VENATNATKRYTPRTRAQLSDEQLVAMELLLSGATDQHVADTVGVHRVTVTRWRLYQPHFRSELIRRRRAAYAGAADSFRTVIPLALDTLKDQLRVGSSRGNIALNLLHKVGLTSPSLVAGIDDPIVEDEDTILDNLLDAEVRRQRSAAQLEDVGDDFAIPPDAPVTQHERQAALDHLLSLVGDPAPPASSDLER
jgi:hypothetical protein